MIVVREVLCKSVLSRSGISSVDYSVNPYVGCEHGCKYCYARFMRRVSKHGEEWGEFVDVKINAPQVLSSELVGAKKGLVLVSSVTDPYQPLERERRLTREILIRLGRHDFPTSILTKSFLVTRDIDVLREIEGCEVGLTITTLDEKVRMIFEPRASPPTERIKALKELSDAKIPTYAFVGPMLPYLTEETLDSLIRELSEAGIGYLLVDRLNIKYGNWAPIKAALLEHFPELVPRYEEVLFSGNGYFERLRKVVSALCEKNRVRCEFCY
jgi:DNA repair photolyase